MQQTTTEVQTPKTPFTNVNTENGSEVETVKIHRWTKDEYYKLEELGFFQGKRVELIEGEIIEMSAMKSSHAVSMSLINRKLASFFEEGYDFRNQLPLSFANNTEPEPDIAVVEGEIRDFAKAHPKTAELIIEVSDTTLSYDRNKKASLYAENKVKDYWILNLNGRCLEVYRKPKKDKQLGFIYTEKFIFTEEDTVSPLANPKARIKIADMLP